MAAGSAHPALANSLGARAGRGDEGEPARGSTRLASSRPRPASQRRKGRSHVTPARRRRRRRGPGCRGGSPRTHRLSPRAGALASRVPADVAMAGVLEFRRLFGTPLGNVREPVVRPFAPGAKIGVGKVRVGSELLAGEKAGVCIESSLT